MQLAPRHKNSINSIYYDVKQSTLGMISNAAQQSARPLDINNVKPRIVSMAVMCGENFQEPPVGVKHFYKNEGTLTDELRGGHYAWFPGHKLADDGTVVYVVFNIALVEASVLASQYYNKTLLFIDADGCSLWQGEWKLFQWRKKWKGIKKKWEYSMKKQREIQQPIDLSSASAITAAVKESFDCAVPFFDGSEQCGELLGQMINYVSAVMASHGYDEERIKQHLDGSFHRLGFQSYVYAVRLYSDFFQWGKPSAQPDGQTPQ